jgi:hypothetical protein
MIYYENTLKLRETDPSLPYLVHQRLDYLVQETLRCKVPYSWRRIAHPHEPNTTVIYLRSATQLGLAGEQAVQLELNMADAVMFNLNFCFPIKHPIRAHQKRSMNLPMAILPDVLAGQCEGAGLSLQSHSANSPTERYLKKKQSFTLQCNPVSVVAEIKDVALAEQAVVYGIGRKRVFGYGQLSNPEVL